MDSKFKEHVVYMELPVSIWEFSVLDTELDQYENIDALHEDIEYLIKESPDIRKRETNVKAHMTKWDMTEHKSFKIISDKVEKTIHEYNHENTDLKIQTHMTTCWGSLYKRGDYSEIHAHVPALYSWVYYVKVEDDAAPLHFVNKVVGDEDKGDDVNDSGLFYQPKNGVGVIFPGYLNHRVPEHKSDSERIIVVGNVEATGGVNYPQKSNRFLKVRG